MQEYHAFDVSNGYKHLGAFKVRNRTAGNWTDLLNIAKKLFGTERNILIKEGKTIFKEYDWWKNGGIYRAMPLDI